MKKTLLCCMTALLVCSCGCADSKQPESSTTSETSAASEASEASKSTSKEHDAVSPLSSSVSDPLALDTWGSASKYSTAAGEYVETPVRLVSVRRGESIAAEVKRLADKSIYVSFSEPNKNEEYALVTYELSLDGFPVKEGGTLIDIYAVVQGTDGEMLRLADGSYFSATALCLNEDAYFYEGIVQGVMAYKIPKGCSDYLLAVGEPGETIAYFQGV